MSRTAERLSAVFEAAPEIPFDDSSRFILFSDCHRGDNGWADDFAHNQTLHFHALSHYYDEGFTYIELGDGDELWENHDFAELRQAHSHIFWLMRQFYLDGRLRMIYGNHDLERQDKDVVARTLFRYFDERSGDYRPLLPDIEVHEGLVLRHTAHGGRLFLVHGHQGDLLSDGLWRFSRFMVRHFWRHMQLVGVNNPTSPAKNYKRRTTIETAISAWVADRRQPLVCGHTHKPKLAPPGDTPYFNTGSCVHPRSITGVEVVDGSLTLIKWWHDVRPDGNLYVARNELVGPFPLTDYWS